MFSYKCNDRLYMSIFFSCVLSCITHVLLIIILLYKYLHENPCRYIKDCKRIQFSLHQIDCFLDQSLEKHNSLGIVKITVSEKEKLKPILHHKKIDKNLNSFENKLNSDKFISSNVPKSLIDSTKTAIDVTMASGKQKNVCSSSEDKIIPYIINRVMPIYPNYAKVLNIEGKITVIYDISNLGKVENIRIFSAIPAGVFEHNVLSAMRRWIYASNVSKKDMIVVFKFCLNTITIVDHDQMH